VVHCHAERGRTTEPKHPDNTINPGTTRRHFDPAHRNLTIKLQSTDTNLDHTILRCPSPTLPSSVLTLPLIQRLFVPLPHLVPARPVHPELHVEETGHVLELFQAVVLEGDLSLPAS